MTETFIMNARQHGSIPSGKLCRLSSSTGITWTVP
jgi:hypothetical protein